MNHLEYVLPAYVLTVGGLMALLLHSWLTMRAAERAAEKIKEQRR